MTKQTTVEQLQNEKTTLQNKNRVLQTAAQSNNYKDKGEKLQELFVSNVDRMTEIDIEIVRVELGDEIVDQTLAELDQPLVEGPKQA